MFHHKKRAMSGATDIAALLGAGGGIAGLPTDLTINSQTVSPSLWYEGRNATVSSWTSDISGTLSSLTGAGAFGKACPTPHVADRCVDMKNAKYYEAASDTVGQVATGDMVFQAIVQNSSAGGTLFTKLSGAGWYVDNAGGSMRFGLNDGSGTTTCTSAATGDVWNHLMLFVDRSGSAQWYINGRASGSPVVVSTRAASLSNADLLELGAYTGSSIWQKRIALAAMWQADAWLDTHLQESIAQECFAIACGVYSSLSAPDYSVYRNGVQVPLCYGSDGITRGIEVGAGWWSVQKEADKNGAAALGYLSLPARTNLLLHSCDQNNVAYTKTGVTTAAPANEGVIQGRGYVTLTEDGAGGNHLLTQAITLATTTEFCFSAIFKPSGTRDWFTLEAYSGASAVTAYFNAASVAVGTTNTAGGATLNAARIRDLGDGHVLCTVICTISGANPTLNFYIAEADGDVTFTGNSSAACDISYMGAEAGDSFSTPIVTTSGTVTTVADRLRWDDATTLALSQGALAISALHPDADAAGALSQGVIYDATGNHRVLLYATAGDVPSLYIDAGTNQANVVGATDVIDGAWREVRGIWDTNDGRLLVAGTSEGTPDTVLTPPSNMRYLEIGANNAGSGHAQGRVWPRVFATPTTKRVAVF